MSKESLLFAASEVYPFSKSGGLADVAYSLPRALSGDYNVDVITPLYQFIDRDKFKIKSLHQTYDISMGKVPFTVALFGCKYEGTTYIFIYSPLLCDREYLYGEPNKGYDDNALRFTIFNYAIIQLLKTKDYEVAHLNDWQTALVPLLIKENKSIKTKSLLTIHNLAYQGLFDYKMLQKIGIDEKYFTMEGLEFYNQVSFIKAGIAYSDMITTVSPNYAKEILTTQFGCGLDGFLKFHKDKLIGILNGLDATHFSPSHDKFLVEPFKDLEGKKLNKKAYLKEVSLRGITKPLFVFIGRLTSQKGVDLLIDILPMLASMECNVAIIGEGEDDYRQRLESICLNHPNTRLEFAYDEALSHRMYASADFLLMPSLFEPCGLNQMIAMSYGCMPIVNRVGGLADTVKEYKSFTPKSGVGYGIPFNDATAVSFMKSITHALSLYADKRTYNKIITSNMLCDFSWTKSAKLYVKSYQQIIKEKKHE